MEDINLCRCCLTDGLSKDLNSTYIWLDKKEVYSEMLRECFDITLSVSETTNSICEECVKLLRKSLCFKQQILRTEQLFLDRLLPLKTHDGTINNIEVKLEPKNESDDDSDDYFLADAIRDIPIEVKEESSEKPFKKRQVAKQIKSKISEKLEPKDASRSDINSLVSKLSTLNSANISLLRKKKSTKDRTKKVSIKKLRDKSDKVLMWSKPSHEKDKHKDNLLTILKYSNATPFKSKSLLGYMCGYCDVTYPDPVDLRVHTENDHQKQRLDFKCRFDMTEYIVKMDVHNLCCTLCEETFDNLTQLRDHLIKMHDKKFHMDINDHILQFKLKKGDVYDCVFCSCTYETFKMLVQHMNKHYCNYTCAICETSFATKRSLSAHKSTHQDGRFQCDHCDKVFSSKPKKQYHEKTKHLGTRSIANCPYCDAKFRSYYQRNQHLVKVHNSEAQYKCNVCNKSYILKSLLMYHIKKNHLMERNCQCTECGFRFFSKKALKAHMVKHTGERNYACEVCHKSYARKYTLREHMRIHNNDRRFKCDVCALTFVQKCSLKSHLLSNHGISMAASDITSVA